MIFHFKSFPGKTNNNFFNKTRKTQILGLFWALFAPKQRCTDGWKYVWTGFNLSAHDHDPVTKFTVWPENPTFRTLFTFLDRSGGF